jgi:hypothetical protein
MVEKPRFWRGRIPSFESGCHRIRTFFAGSLVYAKMDERDSVVVI